MDIWLKRLLNQKYNCFSFKRLNCLFTIWRRFTILCWFCNDETIVHGSRFKMHMEQVHFLNKKPKHFFIIYYPETNLMYSNRPNYLAIQYCNIEATSSEYKYILSSLYWSTRIQISWGLMQRRTTFTNSFWVFRSP